MRLLAAALAFAGFVLPLNAASVAGIAPGRAFFNAQPTAAHGNAAGCIAGNINVTISATTTRFNIASDLSQQNVTELIQELLQTNSPASPYAAGPGTTAGTYTLAATICGPPGTTTPPDTMQVLTNGLGLTSAYWDIAPGNSYVDAAAGANFFTLSYDWLGGGASQHIDPVNAAQFPTHIEVLHALATQLRAGDLLEHNITRVVGVAHSLGSVLQMAAAQKYPDDWDALVLTGVSDTLAYVPQSALSLTPIRAADDPSGRFPGAPGAVLTPASAVGLQQAFYRFPFFSQDVFDATTAAKGTFPLGALLSLPALAAGYTAQPAFAKPVLVALGAADYTFCLGDCSSPSNRAQALLSTVYPAAAPGSAGVLVPETGHFVNAHYSAGDVFARIMGFLHANRF